MAKKQQTQKHKLWATLRILFLGALFYLGVSLIFFGTGFGSSYLVQQNAEQASRNLTVQRADQNARRKTSYDATKTESISTSRIIKSKQKGAYAIGRISIPAVNIHNPLFAGYGDHNQNLEYGVVTCLPDRKMGGANNYVLAGHYMGDYGPAVLDNLHLAKRGDMIYVTDLHHIYAYRIKRISFAIKPSQVEVENNEQDRAMITLITCSDFNTSKYGYGQHRTVVQGDLVDRFAANSENLDKSELLTKKSPRNASSSVSHQHKTIKKVSSIHRQARPKFYQQTGFITAVILSFTVIFCLVIIWQLIRIWRS